MLPHPIGEVASTDAAGGKIQHQAFLIIYGGVDLSAIEKEKWRRARRACCHRRTDGLGPVKSRARLPSQPRLDTDPRHRRWPSVGRLPIRARQDRGCRVHRPSLAEAAGAARQPRPAWDTASGQTPIQLLVLFQHALGSGVEILASRCKQVHDCGPGQFLRLQAETLRLEAQPLDLRRRELDEEFHRPTVSSGEQESRERPESTEPACEDTTLARLCSATATFRYIAAKA